jgi:hypothetical protein
MVRCGRVGSSEQSARPHDKSFMFVVRCCGESEASAVLAKCYRSVVDDRNFEARVADQVSEMRLYVGSGLCTQQARLVATSSDWMTGTQRRSIRITFLHGQ